MLITLCLSLKRRCCSPKRTGLKTHLAAVRDLCAAVHKPVNFMVGIKGKSFTVAELAAACVKRVSFAGSLYRAAITGLLNAAREIKGGPFNYLEQTITSAELNPFLQD